MTTTQILGAIGTLIGLVRALPQFLRLRIARDAHGVSLDTAATSSIVSFGWATYGWLTDQPAVLLATASSGVVFAGVFILALRYGRRLRELRTAPVWVFVLFVPAAIWGPDALGVLLPMSVLVANIPQILISFRESDLTGLSLGTWLLSTMDGLTWGTYAVLAEDRAILVFGILQVVTSSPIVVRRWLWARRRPALRGGRDRVRKVGKTTG